MKTVHHLTELEREKLILANRLLTEVTQLHALLCACCLCGARAMSDVQDPEAFHEACDMDEAGPPAARGVTTVVTNDRGAVARCHAPHGSVFCDGCKGHIAHDQPLYVQANQHRWYSHWCAACWPAVEP